MFNQQTEDTKKKAAKRQHWRRCSSVCFSVQVGVKALPIIFRSMSPICIYNTPSDGLLRNKVNYQKYTEVCQ